MCPRTRTRTPGTCCRQGALPLPGAPPPPPPATATAQATVMATGSTTRRAPTLRPAPSWPGALPARTLTLAMPSRLPPARPLPGRQRTAKAVTSRAVRGPRARAAAACRQQQLQRGLRAGRGRPPGTRQGQGQLEHQAPPREWVLGTEAQPRRRPRLGRGRGRRAAATPGRQAVATQAQPHAMAPPQVGLEPGLVQPRSRATRGISQCCICAWQQQLFRGRQGADGKRHTFCCFGPSLTTWYRKYKCTYV